MGIYYELFRATRGRRRFWAVARVVGGFLFAMEIAYVFAANALLTFGGVQKMFDSTNTVKADFIRGWTVWPGTLHFYKLKVVVANHNIECVVALEHAVLELRLRELPGKVFHSTSLRGSGLSFHFRNRIEPEDAHAPFAKAFPSVPGFEDPPLYEAYVPPPPIPDAKYDLWTVHMENVDVAIDELWVQEFRYLGHARARGKFELKPLRHLWVGPASLELAKGRLLSGADAPLLADFGGHIDCKVDWFDVRIPKGREVLRNISTRVDLSGRLAGADVVRLFADPAADLRVDQVGAAVGVHVGIDHGIATAASRIAISGEALTVRERELRFEARGPWSITASGEPMSPGGKLEMRVAHATADPGPPERFAAPELEDAALALSSSSRDSAAKDWALTGTSFSVGDLSIPDLRALGAFAPQLAVKFVTGSGHMSGHIASAAEELTGEGTASIDHAAGVIGKVELRGSALVRVSRASVDEGSGRFEVEGDARATGVSAAGTVKDEKCPWATADALDVNAHVERAPGRLVDGSVDGSVTGAMASFGDTTFWGSGRVHAATERVSEERSLLRATVRASKLRLRGGDGGKPRWIAHAPDATADATLAWEPHAVRGPLRVSFSRMEGAIGKVQMSAHVSAVLDVGDADLAARSAVASGSVRISDARLSKDGRRIENWWARVAFGPARIRAKENLDLDGTAKAELRDGLPGLLTLSEGDRIPAWLPAVLPLHGLSGTISVHRRCRTTELGIPDLSGGPLTAAGRLSIGPDDTRGAILVRMKAAKVLSAGVALGGEHAGVSLLAGEDWLETRVDALARDADTRARESCSEPPPENACKRRGQ